MSFNQEEIKVIPAIDIREGKCVRLTQGKFNKSKVYFENPLLAVKKFEDAGYKKIHIVDLDAAKGGSETNEDIISQISAKTEMNLQVGGGIRSIKKAEQILNLGVEQIVIGTLAVKKPDLVEKIGQIHGKSKIVISLDARDEEVLISGWQSGSGKNIYDLLQDFLDRGFHYFLVTDIERDGMLSGPNFQLYKKLVNKFPDSRIIASGGVRDKNDIDSLANNCRAYGVIEGKAFYEGRISI